MTKRFCYAIVGAGRQGVASAYDMAKMGDAASVILADYDGEVAERAAQRINRLLGWDVATAAQVDASNFAALVELLEPVDVCLCGTPFVYIMNCTKAAIETNTSFVDYGGHTDTVLQQLALSDDAKAKGISIVPDCGMGPGLNNTMAIYTYEQLLERSATPREARIWDGGLPQNPPPPWGYQGSFHINGLTNEYYGQALVLRDGKVTGVDTLTELEHLEFDELGTLEAFVTSGGSSTVPYTFEGKIQVYENKTLRYPGHCAQFKAFKDLGLFEEEPIEAFPDVNPREFYHALMAPQIAADPVIDVCVMRAKGIGEKDGKEISLTVDLVDRFDEETGFSAMERLTGWHAAIMAEFIARGEVKPGAWEMERAISSTRFMEEIRRRGFKITEQWDE